MSFEYFMRLVDQYLLDESGLTSSDLPDYRYRDAYDSGEKAYDVAMEVLDENNYPTE